MSLSWGSIRKGVLYGIGLIGWSRRQGVYGLMAMEYVGDDEGGRSTYRDLLLRDDYGAVLALDTDRSDVGGSDGLESIFYRSMSASSLEGGSCRADTHRLGTGDLGRRRW